MDSFISYQIDVEDLDLDKCFKKIVAFTLALLIVGFITAPSFASEGAKPKAHIKEAKVTGPTGAVRAAAYYYFSVAQLMINEGDFEGAIKYYKKALKRDPSSPVLYTGLAHLYIRVRENELAVASLEKAVSIAPDYAEALVLSGELYSALKKNKKAVTALKRAIKLDPETQKPYLLLSTLYVNMGEDDKAIKVFKKLIKVKPSSTVSYYYMGRIEADRSNFDKAAQYLRKVLELNPAFAAGYLELGLIYERQKDIDKAIEIYKKGIEVVPYDVNIRNRIGQLLIKQNKLDEALKHFKVVSENGRTRLDAFVKIGLIYYELKRYDTAVEWFEKALAIKPSAFRVRYYLGSTYEDKGDFVKALAEFEMIPKENVNFVDASVHLFFLYDKEKNYSDAIKALSSAIEQKGDDPTLYRLLISVHKEAGLLTRASEIAQKAVKLFPDDADLRFTLGALCDEMNGGLDCLTHMYKAVEMDPANASALNYIGYTYVENGIKLNEAEVLIKRALAVSPSSGHIIDSLGWLYYVKGEVDKAVEALEKAFKALPEDPIIAEHLGDAYIKQSSMKKAVVIFERAHELAPDNAKIESKLKKLKKELKR